MEALETAIAALQAELADPALYTRDAARFASASSELETKMATLEAAEEEWLTLEDKRERLEG